MSDDDEPNIDSASDRLHDAISTVIRDEAKVMVTRWITLVEVMDEDGQPQMWSLTSPRLAMWDHVGMVEFHSRALRPEVP